MNKYIFFTGLILTAGLSLFAQTFSLEDARSLALLNSRSLSRANMSITNASLNEQSRIYSTYLPSLSLGGNASINLWNASNAKNAPDNPWDTFSANASASIRESITFQGNRISIEKAINAMSSESARIDARIEYFNVLDSADSAYYAVLKAMASLEAEENSLQTANISYSMAEIRMASGMLNPGDFLKAQSDLEVRKNAYNQAKRNLTLAVTKLKFLLGLDAIPQPEQIDFSGYEDLTIQLANISEENADAVYRKFLQLLYTSNPTFLKAGISDLRAEKNLSLAKLGYAPTLTGTFSTGVNYSYKDGFYYNAGTLSLSLNVPLDIWVTANNVEKSKISRESAAMDYRGAEITLQTDLQSTLLDCIGNAATILSNRLSLEYAEKNFEYTMERYKLSQSSVKDQSDAESLLISSRQNLINAQYNFLQNLSKLRSMGAIDDEQKLISILMGN